MFRLKATIAISLLTFALHADVIQSDSISVIKQHCIQDVVLKNNKNTFVVLDIDHTIGMCVLKKTLTPWFTHVFYPSMNSIIDRLQHVLKLKPMEDCTVALIQELQHQGFTVLVLTARQSHTVQSTLQHLAGLTLDFSLGLPDIQDHVINTPNLKPATYTQGVIFCCNQDKGEVLAQFLDQNNLEPESIVFVDDLLKNAQSVNTAMTKANIQKVIAVHYTRKQKYNHYTHVRESLKTIFTA